MPTLMTMPTPTDHAHARSFLSRTRESTDLRHVLACTGERLTVDAHSIGADTKLGCAASVTSHGTSGGASAGGAAVGTGTA
eukprot:2991583-Rhodomonas_salina.1